MGVEDQTYSIFFSENLQDDSTMITNVVRKDDEKHFLKQI